MIIFPAIDLYEGKAVRLLKGDYDKMTVYSDNPASVAAEFRNMGATHIHLVDLEGAKNGTTPNIETVRKIKAECGLFTEIGGGVRSMETVEAYIGAGIDRVILGTAAVTDEKFLVDAVKEYGGRIAVGADIKDGRVAIKGWTEKSKYSCFDFFDKMQKIGVETVICTDVSKDGAMQGTNVELYRELSEKFSINICASGGVSSIDDVRRLRSLDLYGTIIGKAYYTGAVSLKEAIEVAK